MSIVNRRNAVIGWATWNVMKQVLKRRATAEVKAAAKPSEQDGGRRFRRSRSEEAEQEAKKKRSKRRLIGLLSASAVGVGIWMGARRRGGGGEAHGE